MFPFRFCGDDYDEETSPGAIIQLKPRYRSMSHIDTVGDKKYHHLSYVTKAALTLSHSNASPEREFSVNNALVTTDR